MRLFRSFTEASAAMAAISFDLRPRPKEKAALRGKLGEIYAGLWPALSSWNTKARSLCRSSGLQSCNPDGTKEAVPLTFLVSSVLCPAICFGFVVTMATSVLRKSSCIGRVICGPNTRWWIIKKRIEVRNLPRCHRSRSGIPHRSHGFPGAGCCPEECVVAAGTPGFLGCQPSCGVLIQASPINSKASLGICPHAAYAPVRRSEGVDSWRRSLH